MNLKFTIDKEKLNVNCFLPVFELKTNIIIDFRFNAKYKNFGSQGRVSDQYFLESIRLDAIQ